MGSLLFYLIIVAALLAFGWLFFYKRRNGKKNRIKRQLPVVNIEEVAITSSEPREQDFEDIDEEKNSPYDPNVIVLQINSFPGKPYMGYELHQTILAQGLRFGEMNLFHRYELNDKGKVLFSLAAATSTGSFDIEDMGGFKCGGLLLFMRLEKKQKLMTGFDLMLDTARQLAEELGGEIFDDRQQQINADAIKRLRERICAVETNNLYTSDLLDNLD